VYTKWNERLFREMYSAYTAGRTNTDPTNGWYDGELRFFDGYVIPLAKKLKECGVFGVSSDEVSAEQCLQSHVAMEFLLRFVFTSGSLFCPFFSPYVQYLNYAEKNRAEWQARGQEVVQSFSSKVARKNSMNNQDKNKASESKESSQSAENDNEQSTNSSNSNNNKQQIADIKVTDLRVSDVKVADMQAKLAESQCKFSESKLGDTDLLDLVRKKQANNRSATVAAADSRSISSESMSSTTMKSPTRKLPKKKQSRKGSLAVAPVPVQQPGSDMNFL
jgi:hypothetical protein